MHKTLNKIYLVTFSSNIVQEAFVRKVNVYAICCARCVMLWCVILNVDRYLMCNYCLWSVLPYKVLYIISCYIFHVVYCCFTLLMALHHVHMMITRSACLIYGYCKSFCLTYLILKCLWFIAYSLGHHHCAPIMSTGLYIPPQNQ